MINSIIPQLNTEIETHFKRINKIEITSEPFEGFKIRIIYDNKTLQASLMCRDFNQTIYELIGVIKEIENEKEKESN